MEHECASTEKRRSARTVKGLASLGSEAQASGRAHKCFSTAAALYNRVARLRAVENRRRVVTM